MSSHYITVTGYLAFLVLGIGLNVLAHRPGSRIPTIGQLVGRLMHTRTGRIAVIVWWAWIGLHVLSK
jgi:Family of unknown function (DUF6186)